MADDNYGYVFYFGPCLTRTIAYKCIAKLYSILCQATKKQDFLKNKTESIRNKKVNITVVTTNDMVPLTTYKREK